MRQTVCHVTCDGPADGVWNMALDDARLTWVADSPRTALWLRFYQWREPTLSLGYFQRLADRHAHGPSRACPVVRRPSGGGAILHDRELTYSLVIPAEHRLAGSPQQIYDLFHTTLQAALAEFGIQTHLCNCRDDRPFLCFLRRAVGDVLLVPARNSSSERMAKICGSAQRRRRGTILQHGSILLARSAAAPELPGIHELSGIAITAKDLTKALEKQLKILHGWVLRRKPTTGAETDPIMKLRMAQYASSPWTARR